MSTLGFVSHMTLGKLTSQRTDFVICRLEVIGASISKISGREKMRNYMKGSTTTFIIQ